MNGFSRGEMHGSTTVGARGQIVIPAKVRAALGILPGERLVVFLRPDRRMVGIIRARDFTRLLSHAERVISKLKRKTVRGKRRG